MWVVLLTDRSVGVIEMSTRVETGTAIWTKRTLRREALLGIIGMRQQGIR
jgi:hypothetical protein